MTFVLAKNLDKHTYIISGKRGYLFRYCDSGFKDKWSGLWSTKKFLDYFAFRINDEWLSPDNCKSFEYDGFSSTHYFELKELKVKEFLFLPEKISSLVVILTIKNLSRMRKTLKVFLEAAVNIRDREENWHDRLYLKELVDNYVAITSSKGSIILGSYPNGKLVGEEKYKDHYPSGEKERCYIPGEYEIEITIEPKSKKDISLIFSCGKDKFESLKNYERTKHTIFSDYIEKKKTYTLLLNNVFYSKVDWLDELFNKSMINLELLAANTKIGFGYFAGYPWFTQFWGRDSGWIIPAIIDCGKFEEAKEALKTLTKFQSDGCIPNFITPDGKTDYNSIDSTLLWIIAVDHYVKHSGDLIFLDEIKPNIIKAINWLESISDKDGFLIHDSKSTWMDTLDRKGKAVEVQAILIEAIKRAGELLNNNKLKERAIKLEQSFETLFWNEKGGFYFDRIASNEKDKTKTINSIFPLLFGISLKPRKILKILESDEFSTKFGIRTISKFEKKYNPAGYHTGSTWGWLISLMAAIEFRNKRTKKGLNYLKILYKNLLQDCINALGEAWNSETNEPILLKPSGWEKGACLQGWSAACVIRSIDEFMLGIKPDAKNKRIEVSPSLIDGMRITRRKKIGDSWINLKFERRGTKVNVKSSNKEYKIIVVPKI